MISRTGSFYALLRQHQPWLAHGDLALPEDQQYYRLGRRTLAEERHSRLFTSLICASQHMANRLKCALPACLRVRTAGGRRMLSRRTASPLRACVWALPACTQFVRSRSQPSRVPTIFEWQGRRRAHRALTRCGLGRPHAHRASWTRILLHILVRMASASPLMHLQRV